MDGDGRSWKGERPFAEPFEGALLEVPLDSTLVLEEDLCGLGQVAIMKIIVGGSGREGKFEQAVECEDGRANQLLGSSEQGNRSLPFRSL